MENSDSEEFLGERLSQQKCNICEDDMLWFKKKERERERKWRCQYNSMAMIFII